jgi:hypothetical protein
MSDRKRALICFPHGIGDVIQATPAMRTLYEQGYLLDMMVRPSVINSHLLDDCPYIGKLMKVRTDTTENGWKEYHIPMFNSIKRSYDLAITCKLLSAYKHRQHQIARELGVEPDDFNLDVWINQASVLEAQEFLKQQLNGKPFIHVHTKTEAHRKYYWDSMSYVQQAYFDDVPDMPIIDTGHEGNAHKLFENINTTFMIMRYATHRVLSISVMAAAADALQLPIDILNCVDKDHHCLPLNRKLIKKCRIGGKIQ